MLRVASLAFILRAGVKVTSNTTTPPTDSSNSQKPNASTSPPQFRTVQARIDTVLYDRLKIAERDLYQRLQQLIFRTAGFLTREQTYPVALVMWQLMRILSIGASHLANLVDRFGSKGKLHLVIPEISILWSISFYNKPASSPMHIHSPMNNDLSL